MYIKLNGSRTRRSYEETKALKLLLHLISSVNYIMSHYMQIKTGKNFRTGKNSLLQANHNAKENENQKCNLYCMQFRTQMKTTTKEQIQFFLLPKKLRCGVSCNSPFRLSHPSASLSATGTD